MRKESALSMWTVYQSPSDYPGRFVVRRCEVARGVITHDATPLAVVDTLEAARAAVPRGLACMHRHPEDQPQIVEVWL